MGVESDAVFEVPTVVNTDPWEYGPPEVPVLVAVGNTIRVLLGTLEIEDDDKPDLMIERRRHGWMIAIHPIKDDCSGIVYIFDDGRSYVVPSGCRSSEIQVADTCDALMDEIDSVSK